MVPGWMRESLGSTESTSFTRKALLESFLGICALRRFRNGILDRYPVRYHLTRLHRLHRQGVQNGVLQLQRSKTPLHRATDCAIRKVCLYLCRETTSADTDAGLDGHHSTKRRMQSHDMISKLVLTYTCSGARPKRTQAVKIGVQC